MSNLLKHYIFLIVLL